MASQAKEILALKTLDVVADKGYYSATEIKNCVDDKIHPIIRRRLSHLLTRNSNKRKRADTAKMILSIVVHIKGARRIHLP